MLPLLEKQVAGVVVECKSNKFAAPVATPQGGKRHSKVNQRA